jgi:hypothetical protein
MISSEELEDLEEMLSFYREQLSYALQQKSALGQNTPFLVRQAIHDNRVEIRRIKAALRAEGVELEDEPNDEAPSPTQAPAIRSVMGGLLARSFGLLTLLIAVLAISFFLIPILRPQSFSYPLRIQSKKTSAMVSNAQVTIETFDRAPSIVFTDQEGLCQFEIDRSYIGKMARVRVEASGFEPIEQEIELNDDPFPDILEIEPLP